MSKDPAILFYTSDFLTGTFTMSNEHTGMYIKLLCIQHQKGKLTEKDMLFICSTYVEDVYSKFSKDNEGFYCNKRLKEESIKRKKYSESRRKNVLSRYDKKSKKKSTYVEHMENENEDENKDKDLNKSSKAKPKNSEEVTEYANSISFNLEGQKFIDYYEARGWELKKGQKVKDWKACVRTWKNNNKSDNKLSNQQNGKGLF